MVYFACLWTSSSATSKKWHVLGSLHPYSSCELDHWKCFPIAAGYITIPYLSSIKMLHFSSSLLSFYLSFLLCFYSTVFLHCTVMVLNTNKVKVEVNYGRNRLTLRCLVSCEHEHFCVLLVPRISYVFSVYYCWSLNPYAFHLQSEDPI